MRSIFHLTFVIDLNGTMISCCKPKANFTRDVNVSRTSFLCHLYHLHFSQELYQQPRARAATKKWLIGPAEIRFIAALYTENHIQEQDGSGEKHQILL